GAVAGSRRSQGDLMGLISRRRMRPTRGMHSTAALLGALLFTGPVWADDAIQAENLKPGLVAIYRDGAKPDPGQYTRLEPTIALVLKADEAPHPRLAANGGSARWQGFINITRGGRYRFRALVNGNFHLWISNKE